MIIYSGQPIVTTSRFDDTVFNGWYLHDFPQGGIAAILYDDEDTFGINLDDDEYEFITDDPPLHDEMYIRGLFDA